jgi:hypothetical protein
MIATLHTIASAAAIAAFVAALGFALIILA